MSKAVRSKQFRRRGCGLRRVNVIYMALTIEEVNAQLEKGLLCPPLPLERLGLTLPTVNKRGTTPLKGKPGYYYDWVSEAAYPDVAHFLSEAVEMGLSLGISPQTAVTLPANAHVVLLHARAVPTATPADLKALAGHKAHCLKNQTRPIGEACCGLHYADAPNDSDIVIGDAQFLRGYSNIGATFYATPNPIARRPGAFAVLRISHLEYIAGSSPEFVEMLGVAQLPVMECEA